MGNKRAKVRLCLVLLIFLLLASSVVFSQLKGARVLGTSISAVSNKVVVKSAVLDVQSTYALKHGEVATVNLTRVDDSQNFTITARSNRSDLLLIFGNNETYAYEQYNIDGWYYYVFYDSDANDGVGNYFLTNTTTQEFTLKFFVKDMLFSGEVEVDLLFKNNTDFTDFSDAVLLDPVGNISSGCTINATAYRCNGSITGQFLNAGANAVWINGATIDGTISGGSGLVWITSNGTIEIFNSTINAYTTTVEKSGNFSVFSGWDQVIINSTTINSYGGQAFFNITADNITIDNSTINNYGRDQAWTATSTGNRHGGSAYFTINATNNFTMLKTIFNNYGGNGQTGGDSAISGSGGTTRIKLDANTIHFNDVTIDASGGHGGNSGSNNPYAGSGGITKFEADSFRISFVNTDYDAPGGNGGTADDSRAKGGDTYFYLTSNFVRIEGNDTAYSWDLTGGTGGSEW